MKITSVDAVPLSGRSPKGGWANEIKPEDSVHTLVIVRTEDGHVGLGSVFTNGALVDAALNILRPLLLGQPAVEPARVTENLHQNMFWMGFGGTITHTISGIDIALWDIFGKITGQPISRLLGGCYREKAMAYASILMEMPDLMAERTALFASQGYKAIKIGWGPFGRHDDYKLDEAIVRAAREGAGNDVRLMVDAGGSDAHWPNGLNWAIRTADMLKDYDVYWFEEALRPDAVDDHRTLRERSPVPIAGCECITRRQNFLPWFEKRAIDIVQPDVTKVGGISEQVQIARMANAFGVRYIGHGWNTAVGLAADLHMSAAFSETNFVEYIGGSPYVDELTVGGWTLDEDGMLDIPDKPGLGISLDVGALQSMTTVDVGAILA